MINYHLVPWSPLPFNNLKIWGECHFNMDPSHLHMNLHYFGQGSFEKLKAERTGPLTQFVRADGLWKKTCFEFFIKSIHHPTYFEFNFSPSGEWNCYSFDFYREGMRQVDEGTIRPHFSSGLVLGPGKEALSFTVSLKFNLQTPLGRLLRNGGWKANVCAILDWEDSEKSYWALHHTTERPDFHAEKAFILNGPCRPLSFNPIEND